MSRAVSLIHTTNATLSSVAFDAIKDEVLGSDYELNVIVVPPEEIRRLNRTYREKDAATDILSFPLSETEGEIYLCLEECKKQAAYFKRTFENFMSFIFIHGCVHLKGYDHGATMERIEAEVRRKFGI